MRIGLISDTHGRLRAEALAALEGVERILHAGDIGSLGILDDLGALAPVTAVWGNTDDLELRSRLPEVDTVEEQGLRIRLVHGHQLGSPTPDTLRQAHPDANVIVYGHTHAALEDRSAPILVVNPGAAGPARFGVAPTVAILTLSGEEPRVEIVAL